MQLARGRSNFESASLRSGVTDLIRNEGRNGFKSMAQGATAQDPTNSHNNHELPANLLDKNQKFDAMQFSTAESISRLPVDGLAGEKPWLFKTLAHNLPRKPGEEAIFLADIARNPLKKLVSQK